MVGSDNPVIARLLGGEGDLGSCLGARERLGRDVISAVGNYGEIYDRNLGPGTPFELERGLEQPVDRRRAPVRAAVPLIEA